MCLRNSLRSSRISQRKWSGTTRKTWLNSVANTSKSSASKSKLILSQPGNRAVLLISKPSERWSLNKQWRNMTRIPTVCCPGRRLSPCSEKPLRVSERLENSLQISNGQLPFSPMAGNKSTLIRMIHLTLRNWKGSPYTLWSFSSPEKAPLLFAHIKQLYIVWGFGVLGLDMPLPASQCHGS